MPEPAHDLASRVGLDSDASDPAEELLAQCLELPEHERAPAIERACASRPELAAELRLRVAALRSMGIELIETRGFPEQLGDFRLIEMLGGGGMGVVYLAVQTSLQRDVALKLIRPEHLFFAGARARFRREAEAVARLQHPGIVPIYAVGEEQGIPYFAMELVRGCTLAEALFELRNRAPESLRGSDLHAVVSEAAKPSAAVAPVAGGGKTLDALEEGSTFDGSWVEVSLRIAKQIADALQHAHERGLVHRDVKPSNIALTPDGRALLLDFGLTSTDGGGDMTRTGAALGTLLYMSPEQVRGARAVDARSDVYSLGVTLYEMLTLQVPYRGENALEMQRLVLDPPDPIRPRNRRVEAEVETAVLCALDRDPSRRYASAADYARDLGHLLAHRPIAARRPSTWLRARRWCQRKPALATALVLGPTLLVGTGLAIMTQAIQHASELDAKLVEVRAAHAATQIQEQRARVEAESAQHALDWVVGMFTPPPLAHGAAMPNEDPADTFMHGESSVAEKLAGDPRAQARMYTMIGRLRARRHSTQHAIELYERALELWRTQDVNDVAAYQSETLCYIGEALHELGRAAEAKQRLQEALDLAPEGEAGEAVRARVTPILYSLTPFASAQDAIEVRARRALDEELARPTPDPRAVAQRRLDLGAAYLGRREYDAAADLFQQSYDELVVQDDGPHSREFPALCAQLGLVRANQGRTKEALALFAQAIDGERAQIVPNKRTLGTVLLNTALFEEESDPEACLAHGRESVALFEEAMTEDHPLTVCSMALHAWHASRLGRCDEAEESACRVLHARGQLDPADPSRGRALMSLAIAAEKRGHTADAEGWWRRAAEALSESPAYQGEAAFAVCRHGLLRLDAGAVDDAEVLLSKACDMYARERMKPPAQLFEGLARVARARGRVAAAESYESRAKE